MNTGITRIDYYDRQGNPVDPETAMALFADDGARRVGLTRLGDYEVSTVFLVLDHSFGYGGTHTKPILFESMIFAAARTRGGDYYLWRYCTEEEALEGHARIVSALKAGMTPGQIPAN